MNGDPINLGPRTIKPFEAGAGSCHSTYEETSELLPGAELRKEVSSDMLRVYLGRYHKNHDQKLLPHLVEQTDTLNDALEETDYSGLTAAEILACVGVYDLLKRRQLGQLATRWVRGDLNVPMDTGSFEQSREDTNRVLKDTRKMAEVALSRGIIQPGVAAAIVGSRQGEPYNMLRNCLVRNSDYFDIAEAKKSMDEHSKRENIHPSVIKDDKIAYDQALTTFYTRDAPRAVA